MHTVHNLLLHSHSEKKEVPFSMAIGNLKLMDQHCPQDHNTCIWEQQELIMTNKQRKMRRVTMERSSGQKN